MEELVSQKVELRNRSEQGIAGGTYKNVDNVIAERDIEGKQGVRFVPVLAF